MKPKRIRIPGLNEQPSHNFILTPQLYRVVVELSRCFSFFVSLKGTVVGERTEQGHGVEVHRSRPKKTIPPLRPTGH